MILIFRRRKQTRMISYIKFDILFSNRWLHLHTHTHTHTHTRARARARARARMRARTHARTHAHTATPHTHTHTHARTHARTRARTHARTHARTATPHHTHTHTHTHLLMSRFCRGVCYTRAWSGGPTPGRRWLSMQRSWRSVILQFIVNLFIPSLSTTKSIPLCISRAAFGTACLAPLRPLHRDPRSLNLIHLFKSPRAKSKTTIACVCKQRKTAIELNADK